MQSVLSAACSLCEVCHTRLLSLPPLPYDRMCRVRISHRRSNPGLELGVMLSKGEQHNPATLAWMDRKAITRIEVEPLFYANHYNPKCTGACILGRRVVACQHWYTVLKSDPPLLTAVSLRHSSSAGCKFCQRACRYGSNFIKLRTLGLTDYDAVIFVDSDVAVVGDLSPLLSLPVEFAAVWDQPKILGR